jgi:hypothetical protein
MSYTKPQVVKLADAVDAIQGTVKPCHFVDSTQTVTTNAYEADE